MMHEFAIRDLPRPQKGREESSMVLRKFLGWRLRQRNVILRQDAAVIYSALQIC